MSNYLPMAAYLMAPRKRRNKLLGIALPAMGGLPAAQVGALSVVSADAALHREEAATTTGVALADQAAQAAVHDTIRIAVKMGAALSVEDFPEGSIARRLADADPDLFEPVSELSSEVLNQIAAKAAEIVKAGANTPTATAGKPGTWETAGSSRPTIAKLVAAPSGTYAASPETKWKTGQYVPTNTSGVKGRAYWDGNAWQKGTAP